MNASLPQGQRLWSATLCAGLLAFLAACNEEDASGGSFKDDLPQPGDARLVYDVTEVNVEVSAGLPLTLYIHTLGNTRTGGWTDVALVLDEEDNGTADQGSSTRQ